MKNRNCLYKNTKYPKIFNKIYWGDFNYEAYDKNTINTINTIDTIDNIIINRNNFIEDNNISGIGKWKLPKYFIKIKYLHFLLFDHIEKYKTKDNQRIIIISPFNPSITNDSKILLEKLGFKQIKPLYHCEATTYMLNLSDFKDPNKNKF